MLTGVSASVSNFLALFALSLFTEKGGKDAVLQKGNILTVDSRMKWKGCCLAQQRM
jgi:hypothetical protein